MTQGPKNRADLIYPDLSYQIVGCSYNVFNELGFGQKEVIYQRALEKELKRTGFAAEREKRFPINYKGDVVGSYMPDFIVENKVVVELKVRPKIGYVHINQVVQYLRATERKLAIIIYFTRDGVKYRRVVNIN
ncbi:MAG: GxxExxY protein [Candidatus Brennerbacteria bacterium]|nr:GxxExxY protein [Candidatus Brennerbacteria bacterium]